MRTRGDFSVVALALLTCGNSLATFWAGGLPVGVVLTAAAAICVWLAVRTAPGAPSPQVIAGGVAISALSLIDHPLAPVLTVVVLVIALVGVMARRFRLGMLLVVAATIIVVVAEAMRLQWGHLAFDVFSEMQVATGALAHAVDPYRPTVQAMIPVSDHGAYLTPEHFGYGPGILLLGLPGRLLGDVRLSQAAVWVAIAVVIATVARRQPSAVGVGSAALVLLSPFGVDLAEHAFNDATGVLCLLLWFLGRQRHPRWARLALGVALTTKPTILAGLLVMLVWSRSARRDIWWGLGIAAAIVVPFALWDGIGNFLHATVELWLGPVFLVNRADAITVGAFIHTYGLPYLPSVAIITTTLLTAVVTLRRRPRDSVDLLLGGAMLTIGYLILGHIAFLNYYSVAAALLMAAIAIDGNARFTADDDIALPGGRHSRSAIVSSPSVPATVAAPSA
jgi:Glycosyltransferase family 87